MWVSEVSVWTCPPMAFNDRRQVCLVYASRLRPPLKAVSARAMFGSGAAGGKLCLVSGLARQARLPDVMRLHMDTPS